MSSRRKPVQVPLWTRAPDGEVQRTRRAEFAKPGPDKMLTCGLCYRECTLAPDQDGPCGYRGNADGQMALHGHGVVSSVVRQIRGYGPDPFLTYKPGMTSLFLGGTSCTSTCTFCMSAEIVWKPSGLPELLPTTEIAAPGKLWYAMKALLHPIDAVSTALHAGCASILFGVNEPTLSFEWTLDVARLAKAKGLDVVVESNGFTTPKAIRRLAPYVDAVDVGTKGSLDPEFYSRWMKSPGAEDAVRQAMLEWRAAGVHLTVGDLVASPFQQSDVVFEDSAARFYAWIAEHLGPITDVLVTGIAPPGPLVPGKAAMLLGPRPDSGAEDRYAERQVRAVELAQAGGLPYAHQKAGTQRIDCHACGGVLLEYAQPRCDPAMHAAGDCLMSTQFCPHFGHRQFVTDSRCDHCGVEVPIVTMSSDDLARQRRIVAEAQRR